MPQKAIHVSSDSEEERVSPKKKNAKAKEPSPSDEEMEDARDTGEEEEEEEFEIEIILDAKPAVFPGVGSSWGYQVKWKGYSAEHNSWVSEEDAEGAKELIDKYWKSDKAPKKRPPHVPPKSTEKKKRGRSSAVSKVEYSDESGSDASPRQKSAKRPKKSDSAARSAKKSKNEPESSDPERIDQDEMISMDKWMKLNSWEDLIEKVDTIEREEGGNLRVYFSLTTGEHSQQSSSVCAAKFPQKLIKFYESHLSWKAAGEPHE